MNYHTRVDIGQSKSLSDIFEEFALNSTLGILSNSLLWYEPPGPDTISCFPFGCSYSPISKPHVCLKIR